MDSVAISMVIVPGVVALLLFLVFTYLYEQSRQAYFRAWQFGWAAFTLHYVLDAVNTITQSQIVAFLGSLLLVTMAVCIFVSTRLMRDRFRLQWYDILIGAMGAGLAFWNVKARVVQGAFRPEVVTNPHFRLEIFLAAILLYASLYFYRHAHRKNSLAFRLLAMSLALWAVLMVVGQFRNPFIELFGVS